MVVGYAQGAGNAVDPGRSELVLTLTPGTGQLRCLHPKTMVDAGEWRSFDVLAPEGWVSPELDCSGTRETGIYDYVPGALGVTDPFADAQSRAPGAILEEAGYRAEGTHTILAVEDGIPTQLFFYDAVHGGTRWLLGKVQSCST